MVLNIKPKFVVDENTAEICLNLVEQYINDNDNIDITCTKRANGEYKLQFFDRGFTRDRNTSK